MLRWGGGLGVFIPRGNPGLNAVVAAAKQRGNLNQACRDSRTAHLPASRRHAPWVRSDGCLSGIGALVRHENAKTKPLQDRQHLHCQWSPLLNNPQTLLGLNARNKGSVLQANPHENPQKAALLMEQLFHRKSKSPSGMKPCLCAYQSLGQTGCGMGPSPGRQIARAHLPNTVKKTSKSN